jgi:hypothetical protein
VQTDASRLPFPDASFDAVIANHSLELTSLAILNRKNLAGRIPKKLMLLGGGREQQLVLWSIFPGSRIAGLGRGSAYTDGLSTSALSMKSWTQPLGGMFACATAQAARRPGWSSSAS